MHVGKCVGKNHVSYVCICLIICCFTGIITDTAEFLPYVDMMTPHLTLLGTALGIDNLATAIVNGPGGPQAKCLDILRIWLGVTPNPSWDLFCEKLGRSPVFNNLRGRIAKDQDASGVTVIQVIVILMWMYVVDTCIPSRQWFCYGITCMFLRILVVFCLYPYQQTGQDNLCDIHYCIYFYYSVCF